MAAFTIPQLFSLRPIGYAIAVGATSLAALGNGNPEPLARGIALAVVFDTSGSMRDPIARKSTPVTEAKHHMARRTFETVIRRLAAFTRDASARPLQVGVYVFGGDTGAVACPIGPFDAERLQSWLSTMRPDGVTPLGETMALAGQHLLATAADSRHLLVLTDGYSTVGRKPADVLATLNADAVRANTPFFAHVIAFDVATAPFVELKHLGATLIGAADEKQLNAQFDFILNEKILVEAPR